MQALWPVVGFMVAGYLCGAIPFGLIFGRLKGVDVRTVGSGNIGANNVARVLGWRWGVLTFALDFLKGFLPVLAFGWWRSQSVTTQADWVASASWIAVAAGCILGHVFPVYLRFRGGKGVATSLGAVLAIPAFVPAALGALGVWVVLTLVSRISSVGSMAAAAAFPIIFAVSAWAGGGLAGSIRQLWPMHAFAVGMALLVLYRHRGNLQRLLAGAELRIGTLPGARH